jgi:hypothetical protein
MDAHLLEDRTSVYLYLDGVLRREKRGRVSLKTEKKEAKETKSVYKEKLTRSQSGFQYFHSSNMKSPRSTY